MLKSKKAVEPVLSISTKLSGIISLLNETLTRMGYDPKKSVIIIKEGKLTIE